MAISTAAVLYSFFKDVKSPKRGLGLWKCLGIGFKRPVCLARAEPGPRQAQNFSSTTSTTEIITTRFKHAPHLMPHFL
jgi:hypothetical protein